MKDPNVTRFVCPVCRDADNKHRVYSTDKLHKQCEYCGEACVPMKDWVRQQARKGLKP